MAWSYSGNPATSERDAVRFWLQDTDESLPLFADGELDYLIGYADPIWGSPIATAAMAADILVAKFGTEVAISADGVSIAGDQLSDKYKAIAANLRDQYSRIQGAGAMPIAFGTEAFPTFDLSVKPTWASLGGMDNPRAGQQDFGENGNREYFGEIPESGYWTGN